MDPAGVEEAPDKWGVITRLLHLDDILGGNSPFKLFQKAKVQHFKLEIGEVGLETSMPVGIGIQGTKSGKTGADALSQAEELVFLDPMTKELISKVPQLDTNGDPKLVHGKPVYQINDHWFVLNVKFVWRDAPEVADTGGLAESGLPAQPMPQYPMRPTAPVSRPTRPRQSIPEEDW